MSDNGLRLTIRRWMSLVLLAAIALAVGVKISNRRKHADYARARRVYEAAMRHFGEGKIDLMGGVLASEQLMNAELSRSHAKENEIAATSAHLGRARALIDRERQDGLVPHHDTEADIAEVELRLSRSKERLNWLRSNK
jgi:hypothetical protein